MSPLAFIRFRNYCHVNFNVQKMARAKQKAHILLALSCQAESLPDYCHSEEHPMQGQLGGLWPSLEWVEISIQEPTQMGWSVSSWTFSLCWPGTLWK